MRIKIWDKLNASEDEVEGWLEVPCSDPDWQGFQLTAAVQQKAEQDYKNDSEMFQHGSAEYQVRVEGRDQPLTVQVWVDYHPSFSARIQDNPFD